VSFNDRFENLTIFEIFLLEISEIGNAHAGEAHKTKEVSCPGPLVEKIVRLNTLCRLLLTTISI
jgi:hypothetical protein